jgi:hypothetical protein
MITITFTPETPEQLAAVAQAMAAYLGASAQGETVADEAPKAMAPARKRKPAAEPSEPEAPAAPPAQEISLEQVRAKLVVISQAGKGGAVAALLSAKYGVKNLTAVPQDQLAALLADAEAL